MTTPEPLGGDRQEPELTPSTQEPAPANPPAPATPYAPANPAATATLPPQPPRAKAATGGLALAALIVGIAAFLFGLIPVFGALVGITAVVLGFLALRKQQSKGMAVAGIILGGLAVLSSIGMTLGLGAAVNNASVDRPVAPITQSTSPATQPSAAPKPAETKEPAAAPKAPDVSPEFASALKKAKSYSDLMHMSKAGLYNQLTSEYGEKFSPEAAQYAIDNVQADWNANALAKAKSYQTTMSMSPEAIRDQLTSEYGEQFTPEEADYAIQHLND